MSSILVTGGAGFIGSNFVRLALERTPDDVVVLDKLTYAGSLESLREVESDPRFRFVRGDIADRDDVRSLLLELRPRAVVNFAAESHVDRSIDGPGDFLRTNVVGTFELLEGARALLAETPELAATFRFLHVSTDEVYGSLGDDGLFSETTPYDPSSPYSATKASADHLVSAWYETFGIPTITTNCSNNYGPFQFPEKLIPLMLLNAREGKDLPIYGDGLNVRDWLYVGDHCEGILSSLEKGEPGRSYNIGGGNERTNLELVDLLCDFLDEAEPASENPAMQARGLSSYRDLKTFVKDRPGHDRRYAIDATRIRTELGWEPRHDLESGLRATVGWYLEHLDWCEAVQGGGYDRGRLGLGSPTEDGPDGAEA